MTDELLRITTTCLGDSDVVRVEGELDMATAPLLAVELTKTVENVARTGRVVVDMARVTFFGSAGLAALLDARERCATGQVPLLIAAPSPMVARALQISGMDQCLTVVASVEAAVGQDYPRRPAPDGNPPKG